MAVSVFDLFKIGIGPSSSHTVGPMRAAGLFVRALEGQGLLPRVHRVRAELYGSLGATGKGHGSDKALLLGLSGHAPDTVDVDGIPELLETIHRAGRLALGGTWPVAFDAGRDLIFHRTETLPLHANGMRFVAHDAAGHELHAATYYSVGGGFVVSEAVLAEGEMWLRTGEVEEKHLRPGDLFKLEAEAPHAERHGPQGAVYWVARQSP